MDMDDDDIAYLCYLFPGCSREELLADHNRFMDTRVRDLHPSVLSRNVRESEMGELTVCEYLQYLRDGDRRVRSQRSCVPIVDVRRGQRHVPGNVHRGDRLVLDLPGSPVHLRSRSSPRVYARAATSLDAPSRFWWLFSLGTWR